MYATMRKAPEHWGFLLSMSQRAGNESIGVSATFGGGGGGGGGAATPRPKSGVGWGALTSGVRPAVSLPSYP
jgi:hypothetical protein